MQKQAARMLSNCSEDEADLSPESHIRSVWALEKKYREVYCNAYLRVFSNKDSAYVYRHHENYMLCPSYTS
jgi:hypothetical protein